MTTSLEAPGVPQQVVDALAIELAHAWPTVTRVEARLVTYVDLRFWVQGDLYDGETVALAIEQRLSSKLPGCAFDLVVLPEGEWREEP